MTAATQAMGARVKGMIEEFIRRSPENNLQNGTGERAFENPLVAFVRGDDPLFESYKQYVGPFHWTPREAFGLGYPKESAASQDLAVITWILPQTEATKQDNRAETIYPAERWARARIFGEEVNAKLRKAVVRFLQEAGVPALAPQLMPEWQLQASPEYAFASTWSERHAAHAAGLGTFGLCDGLITPRGKAVRVGSVIARLAVGPADRPYSDPRAYCLFFSQGTCGECIQRCPVGALSRTGHNKERCLRHLKPNTARYVKTHYGFDGYGCGLCQTGVPCESGIPEQ